MKAMSYDQDHQELTSTPTNNTFDWFDDSISFLAGEDDLGGYDWWSTLLPAAQQDGIGNTIAQTSLPPPAPPAGASSQSHVAATTVASPPLEIPKKRKSLAHKASGHYSQCRGVEHHKEDQSYNRKPSGGGSKKGGTKGGATSSNKDTRWAEQLLNPCAVALEAGNLPRVQHLLYVLGELASFSGDVNHRLAAHGLRALALRLPAAVGPAVAATVRVPPCECPTPAFARADPRLFRASLIKFQEVSPWFALPNALANAAIAHAATRDVHVIDVGVSHGVQWPTLLEAFTRLPSGREPPAVRLSVAGPTATALVPFSASPPCYNFSPHLLRYAKSINLELAISTVTSLDLVRVTPGETLVVCLQFRLGHVTADKRTDILRKVRGLNPELVVLSELDTGGDGSAAGEFAARLELLWRFLESTAAAFKGREGEERRLMEAEAGTAVAPSAEEAGEGREGWRGRMTAAGFEEVALGDEPVEAAKSLLRKYDGGWEMAVPTAAAAVLRWKGQPVSFCSLWRPA